MTLFVDDHVEGKERKGKVQAFAKNGDMNDSLCG
jgi:hypothetical protein